MLGKIRSKHNFPMQIRQQYKASDEMYVLSK